MKTRCALWCALAILFGCSSVAAQRFEDPALSRPQLFVDSRLAVNSGLGYRQPFRSFGLSVELPVAKRVEFHADFWYSPDKKVITNDGTQFLMKGTALVWLTHRIGITGSYQRDWLWTSQFNEQSSNPLPGIVVRNHYAHPGRFYLSYLLPTGCVWATPSNPCLLQSKRTQGFQLTQEYQMKSYLRFSVGGTITHFCDQSNENDPAAGRTCHLTPTVEFGVKVEFPPSRDLEKY
jgi:hypothetical protein